MYVYIKGILKSKNKETAIIENAGIGYELSIGLMTYNSLPEHSQEVMLYTYHYIREDREELYGFSTTGERSLFEILIGVPSIGPSKAINILSQVLPGQFAGAISRGDITAVASIKGLGRKTAERMVLDLKEKIAQISIAEVDYGVDTDKLEDALNGLVSLGFKDNVAREMLHEIRDEIDKTDETQDIMKKALKKNG
ncbi:MAG: Holliday junction branch migration protein RuvA [Elusimicrobiota bacterium]